jgi:hypothetical protein
MLMHIAIDEIRLRPPRKHPANVHFLFCDATQTTSAYTVNDRLVKYHQWQNQLPIHHAELYAFLACLGYAYALCDEHPDDEVAIGTDNQLVLAMYTTGHSRWLSMPPMQLLAAMTTIAFYKLRHGRSTAVYYVASHDSKADVFTRRFMEDH